MATVDALLAVFDQQMRGVEPTPPAGVRYEQDGPLLRAAGGHRGYICGPRDIGVTGAELDRLIARQRDYFAGRGEAVGWQTRAHDEPADLTARLRAAGFLAGEERTVLIGLTAELATAPVLPGGIAAWLLRVTPAAGFAVLQSVPQYPQVAGQYSPFNGYYPLAPWAGFAVLCGWAVLALGLAIVVLRRRDV